MKSFPTEKDPELTQDALKHGKVNRLIVRHHAVEIEDYGT